MRQREPTNTQAAILDRIIGRDQSSIPVDAARYFLSLSFDAGDRERMNLLAARSREGEATAAELAEAGGYCQVGHFLALIQSKARKSLTAPQPLHPAD
jgi:hypothetical protein